MPGIDYDQLREEIRIEDVLRLIRYEPNLRRGDQWYGYCPFHDSTAKQRTVFAINLAGSCYYCHKCKQSGNQLELWATVIKMPLHSATIELCKQLGKEIPWIYRW